MLVSVARLGPLAYRPEQILTENRFHFIGRAARKLHGNNRFLTQSNANTA
jgi:hypothetical protein